MKEKRKGNKILVMIILFMFIIIVTLIVAIKESKMSQKNEKDEKEINKYNYYDYTPLLINLNEFKGITTEELVEKMGEPTSTYTDSEGLTYKYEDGKIKQYFIIEDNKVAVYKWRSREYRDYYIFNNTLSEMFNSFGIEPNFDTMTELYYDVNEKGATVEFGDVNDIIEKAEFYCKFDYLYTDGDYYRVDVAHIVFKK